MASKFVIWVGAGASRDAHGPDWADLNVDLLRSFVAFVSSVRSTPGRQLTCGFEANFAGMITGLNDAMTGAGDLLLDRVTDGFRATPQELQNLVAAFARFGLPKRLRTRANIRNLGRVFDTELQSRLGSLKGGPLAHAIHNVASRHSSVEVVTTNFDTLIETSCGGPPTCSCTRSDAIAKRVHHIHGVVPGTLPVAHATQGYILSDSDFVEFASPGGVWQWADLLAADVLTYGRTLFVGTSLSDPNLLRWLSGPRSDPKPVGRPPWASPLGQWNRAISGAPTPHNPTPMRLALMPRSAYPDTLAKPGAARDGCEQALRARWWSVNVRVVTVDAFADVTEFVSLMV